MNKNWLRKDFYRMLEVNKNADPTTIKRSYRRLAQKLHPDANNSDEESAERFKAISEAYAVLSDPKQKTEYDQARMMASSSSYGPRTRQTNFGNFGGDSMMGNFRISDIMGGLGDLFGVPNMGQPDGTHRTYHNEDMNVALNLSFEESITGTITSVHILRNETCEECEGDGIEPDSQVDTCVECDGSGITYIIRRPVHCALCSGSGQIIQSPCRNCSGASYVKKPSTINVEIPAGVKDGNVVRVSGMGHSSVAAAPSGDLLITLLVAEHPVFTRKGNNLHLDMPISFTDAALGCKLEVPTIGGTVRLKIPAGTQPGRVFRVRRKGVPRLRGGAGDMLVTVTVEIPTKLNKPARKLLEQFRELYESDRITDNNTSENDYDS